MKPIFYFCLIIFLFSSDLGIAQRSSNETEQITVEIFISNSHRVLPSIHETVTEEILLVEEHHEGATFTINEEEGIEIEGHTVIDEELNKKYSFQIFTNTNSLESEEDILCFEFYGALERLEYPSISRTINSTYETWECKKVLKDGNGKIIEAKYGTRSFDKLVKPARLERIDNSEREFVTYQFVVPANMKFKEYFMSQIDDPEFELIYGVNYRIR